MSGGTRAAQEVSRSVKWHKSVPGDPLIHYKLLKYGQADFLNGQLVVSAACASFVLKGEDKHTVVYAEKGLEECQKENDPNVPLLLAFVGVFDGHGGHMASSYCAHGLLPHVLTETSECIKKQHKNELKMQQNTLSGADRRSMLQSLRYHQSESLRALDGTFHNDDPLECGFINAYHRAHIRFGSGSDPPTFQDVVRGKKYTRYQQRGFMGRLRHGTTPHMTIKGGTTACTLAIYAERSKLGDAYRPMPYALVANCGDSRLITDDGTGGSNYRQVTTDHRPCDPLESERLRQAKDITEISVKEDPTEEPHPILRLFPGGLAVSRTIGDVSLTKAAIPTPDIFRVPLHVTKEETATKRETHQRFILGTDGLFDVMSNEEIGRLAARVQETEDGSKRILSTRDATEAVMNHCLTYADHFDDINLLVVDVNYFAADETNSHHEG